ncbi:MAG: alanine racemase [Pseudomonadota bacterium]|nr:alanine racemase [Pseudomonadota bacterium]
MTETTLPEAQAGAVLDIDLGAIADNWRALRARHATGAVAGVVKANAYGLGAEKVVPALYRAGCRHFFTALLDEALAIRDLIPDAMLAVLNGLFPGTEAAYVARDIVPVLGSLAEIDAWAAIASTCGRRLPGIVHLDTGMARLGLSDAELAVLAADQTRLRALDLRFVMSHLVAAEEADNPLNETQRRRFALACGSLPPAPRSLANSSGIFLGAGWGSELARPGAALYGINPTPGRPNPMRPVVRLRARVLAVRDVAVGETVGYGATWHATRPSRIATAAVGYADGWHRSQSNRGTALFDGRPLPLVGRVSMDLATFNASDHPALCPGDWLDLIGPGRTPDDVAAAAGTNGYEVLTSLGRRFQRIYRCA